MNIIELKSPYTDQVAKFNWQVSQLTIFDGSNEIINAIRFLCSDLEPFNNFLAQHIQPQTFKSCEQMRSLCDKFNQLVDDGPKRQRASTEMASADLIKFVLQTTYNRAVVEPEKLNQYEPFSPQVYGETSNDLVDQMLKKVALKETDVFIDLGSGVGNVVLQVAATVRCKRCYGIEKADWPAYYAEVSAHL